MDFINQYLGQRIEFDILGDGMHIGILLDVGMDIIVVLEESKFLYVPLHHVRHLTLDPKSDPNIPDPELSIQSNGKQISYALTLSHAKGLFCEIYLADHQSMFGYITHVQADYFILVSPINKIIIIPIFHLKWMRPYNSNSKPYSLNYDGIVHINSTKFILSQTFEEQLKQHEGNIISLNEGLNFNNIGLLQKFENNILEMVSADEKKHYYHLEHIKNVSIR
jgi:hypothetical protein